MKQADLVRMKSSVQIDKHKLSLNNKTVHFNFKNMREMRKYLNNMLICY